MPVDMEEKVHDIPGLVAGILNFYCNYSGSPPRNHFSLKKTQIFD